MVLLTGQSLTLSYPNLIILSFPLASKIDHRVSQYVGGFERQAHIPKQIPSGMGNNKFGIYPDYLPNAIINAQNEGTVLKFLAFYENLVIEY